MIAAEQSYSLQMGDHDSSKGVHMLPLAHTTPNHQATTVKGETDPLRADWMAG
jgi:hypothetical protein